MIKFIGYAIIVGGFAELFFNNNKSGSGWLWVILGNIHLLQAQHNDTIRFSITEVKDQLKEHRKDV